MSTDEIVERMRKDIEIEIGASPGRDAGYSHSDVYYSSSDPLLAQHVTNELTNLFINENLEAATGTVGKHYEVPGKTIGGCAANSCGAGRQDSSL